MKPQNEIGKFVEVASQCMLTVLSMEMPEQGITYQRYLPDMNLYMVLIDGRRIVAYDDNETPPHSTAPVLFSMVGTQIKTSTKHFKAIMQKRDTK